MEEMAELWITVDGIGASWDDALSSLDRAVDDAIRKGHNVEVETSVINARHIFAIDSAAKYDPKTKKESVDCDGLYYAFGKFIQQLVEAHGEREFGLSVERNGTTS